MTQVLVLAKAPVAGRVKTRLCPPCTPEQAAAVAAAALGDTLDAVTRCTTARRILALDGSYAAPPRWTICPQRGDTLGPRLTHAFADTRRSGTASLLLGMDTPQVTPGVLDMALGLLTIPDGPDAVFGPALDGGWWSLGLRDPRHADLLTGIATSTATTGAETLAALRARDLEVAVLPALRDVDTVIDAYAVAASCPPDSRFARAVAANVPATAVSR
jgi:glycosyltransferase A (GT-A) superfamily protein (DUF2064 family)